MAAALPVIGAMAGATWANKQTTKMNEKAFNNRMQNAEKYGIHPLQAIGSAGTLQGTGGLNIGSMMQNEKSSRKYYEAKKNTENREDRHRLEDKAHQMQMLEIQNAAKDRQTTRTLEDDARGVSDYLYQGKNPWESINSILDQKLEMYKFQDRQRRLYQNRKP